MAADTPTAMLIPIGQPLGMDFARDVRSGARADPDGVSRFTVRVGPRIARLADEQFGAWHLAHGGGIEAPGPVTRHGLQEELRAAGVVDPGRPIESLCAIGLIREVPTDRVGRLLFARTHRLQSLMTGLGNSPERPSSFALGLHGRAMATTTATTYRLITRAGMYRSLLEAAVDLADQAAPTSGRTIDPEAAIGELFDEVYRLLSVNAVFFEPVADHRIDAGET